MNRKQKIILSITVIFLVLLLLVGLTYAYFLTQITGNTNNKSISVTTANLSLTYNDGTTAVLTSNEPIMPGKFTASKDFSVTNDGNATVENYAVYLEDVTNTFQLYNDLKVTLTCTSVNTETGAIEGTCDGMSGHYPNTDDMLVMNTIDAGITHEYVFTLTYEETGVDQSVDMGSTIEGKFQIYDQNTVSNLNVTDKQYLISKLYGETVEIGDEVNYEDNVSDYAGKWYILGIENGSLLLLSSTAVGNSVLSYLNGYNTGISVFNETCAPYGKGEFAIEARSIKAEDINALVNYNPEKTPTGLPHAYNTLDEYGITGTYKIENGKLLFSASNGITGAAADYSPEITTFYDKDTEAMLQEGETTDPIKSTSYYYSITTNDVPATDNIIYMKTTDKIFTMLKNSIGTTNGDQLWLATQSTILKPYGASYGFLDLKTNIVNGEVTDIFLTRHWYLHHSAGYDPSGAAVNNNNKWGKISAVVKLDSKIKLNFDSTNGYWNISK